MTFKLQHIFLIFNLEPKYFLPSDYFYQEKQLNGNVGLVRPIEIVGRFLEAIKKCSKNDKIKCINLFLINVTSFSTIE